MELKSCYVESFGTLKDVEIEFSSGLNAFLCDNGLGKTTLISFIKAMLFGLDYKQSGGKFYERTRALPWDESTCRGSLTIEVEGVEYRIERTFGKKKNDDTFKLIEVSSMMESKDYSENIGEELFGVDKASFEKSLYFGQGQLSTGITPSLNAKMGNISDVKDDMSQFDLAISRIDKAKSEYEKRSKTNPGKINIIDKEIKLCEEAAEKIKVLENAVIERKGRLFEKTKKIEELSKQKEELGDLIKSAAEEEKKSGVLLAKKDQLGKAQKESEKALFVFNGNIPKSEELEELKENQRLLLEKESRLSEIRERLPKEDRVEFLTEIFAKDVGFSSEMLEKSLVEAKDIAKLRLAGEKTAISESNEKELEESREFFKEKLPTSEEISGYIQLTELITKEETKLSTMDVSLEEAKRELNGVNSSQKTPYFVIGLIGVLFVAAGIVSFILLPEGTLSVVGLMAGLVLGAIMIIISTIFTHQENQTRRRLIATNKEKVKLLQDKIQESLDEIKDKRNRCLEFIRYFMEANDSEDIFSKLMEIQRRLDDHNRLLKINEVNKRDTAENTDALAELTMNLYTRLGTVEEKYGYDLHKDHLEEELLEKISSDLREYDEYLKNYESYINLEREVSLINENLAGKLDRYNFEEEKTFDQKIQILIGTLETYKSLEKQMEDLEEEIKTLSGEEKDGEEVSVEELQAKLVSVDEAYEPLVSDRAKEEEELSRVLNEIEENEEALRKLSSLKEQREEMAKKVHILSETKKYLEKARDEFLSVYMKPLREGMDKYVNMLVPSGVEDDIEIGLDMELNVKLLRKGATLTGEYLSAGYKDLADLCARLALIDVLYKKEKPPIFMDDPFTNLDENKIQRALDVLGELSEKTQIIYFACHESRTKSGFRPLYKA